MGGGGRGIHLAAEGVHIGSPRLTTLSEILRYNECETLSLKNIFCVCSLHVYYCKGLGTGPAVLFFSPAKLEFSFGERNMFEFPVVLQNLWQRARCFEAPFMRLIQGYTIRE